MPALITFVAERIRGDITPSCNDDTDCNSLPLTLSPAPPFPRSLPPPTTTRPVFFQPDFSVSLRAGMQFTELFLNPSGGTTAEKEESAAEKKETRAEKRRKRRRRKRRRKEVEEEVEERGWRQPWRQLFCPGGAPPPSALPRRFLYVSLPGSPVPISPPIHRSRPFSTLEYSYTRAHGLRSTFEHEETRVPSPSEWKIARTDFSTEECR